MNRTWGLVLALVCGAVIGWVVPQFDSVTHNHQSDSRNDSLMSRNEARLTRLKLMNRNISTAQLTDEPVTERDVDIKADELDQLLDNVSAGRVELAIQQYRENLNDYAQNLSLSRIVAEKWLAAGDYEALLGLLYEQRLFIGFEHEQALLELIFATVNQIEVLLAEQNDSAALVSLYRFLISLHGDHTPYYLSLTYWLIESGDLYAAEESLAGAVNDIAYQEQVEILKARIDGRDLPLKEGVSGIPLRKIGEHYVIEILLDEQYPVKLMIDTGASLSTLKSELVDQFASYALADAGALQMNTANGSVSGQKIRIRSFRLGTIQLNDVDMGVVPLPDFDFDGLLGMNVLSQFKFFIDQEKHLLVLR